jgi:citrate synthase
MKEQWESGNRLFRPSQIYKGPAIREYKPLSVR